jgi:hypothetical protein
MGEEVTHDISQHNKDERLILTSPFTKDEVFEAISQMGHNKSPRSDGFPVKFYQKFWDVIKNDTMALFMQLQNGELPLYKLNFGVI